MEWIETTAKTLAEAQELALDRLGVAADEAEFEVLEEPRAGLFGRLRGEARVRARVKPAAVRPKQDRRNRGKRSRRDGNDRGGQRSKAPAGARSGGGSGGSSDDDRPGDGGGSGDGSRASGGGQGNNRRRRGGRGGQGNRDHGGERSQGGSRRDDAERSASDAPRESKQQKEQAMDQEQGSPVTPEEVGAAAVAFMSGLTEALGADADTSVEVDGTEIDVSVSGGELGLLVGPGGRTLTAVQGSGTGRIATATRRS